MSNERKLNIGYIIPGVGLSDEEVKRRRNIANKIMEGIAYVDIITVDKGPNTIETTVEEAYAATSYLDKIYYLSEKYDAFVVGCFGDPGLRAARELTDKVVIGPAEASLHVASMLADKFIILTPLESTLPMTRDLIKLYGFEDKVSDIVAVTLPVIEFIRNRDRSIKVLSSIINEKLSGNSGEAIILGCMSMGFLLVDEYLEDKVDVPIINPVKTSLKMAWLISSLNLSHSIKCYPKVDPKKLRYLF